jgi:DNA-binding MurR/RpiR family transcriptional regulator
MPYEKLLSNKAGSLTPSQRKLLDFILANDEEAVFLNINALAQRVQVSVATVVRLSRALGFKGFIQFQMELRNLFKEKRTTISRLEKTTFASDGQSRILLEVMRRDLDNINETMNQVDPETFCRFVEALNAAEQIVIVGLRSAHSLSVFMGVALEFLQREVWIVQPGIGNMWDRMFRLKDSAAVVGIGFPRYTRQTVEVLQFAKGRQIQTLAITDSLVSPLARNADLVLTARCRMDSFIESFVAPLSLINAIVTALGVSHRDASLDALQPLEKLWKERGIYFDE